MPTSINTQPPPLDRRAKPAKAPRPVGLISTRYSGNKADLQQVRRRLSKARRQEKQAQRPP
jgi:hypothetical protein